MTTLYTGLSEDLRDADVVIMRRGVPQTKLKASDPSAVGRANLVRDVALEVKSADTLVLGRGLFDFGLQYFLLPRVKMTGWGMGETVLLNSQEEQANYCGFELQRGTRIESMTLLWKPKDDQIRGGQTLGIARRNAPPMIVASLSDVEVLSYGGSAFYFWGGGIDHFIRSESCRFAAGRWPVVIGSSTSAKVVTLELNDCGILGNFSIYGGAGGDMGLPPNTTGLLLRGGTATMNGGLIKVVGTPGFELAIGAAASSLGDHGYPNLPTAGMVGNLTLNNVDSRVEPNGVTHAVDLWDQAGVLNYTGGTGSGPNGSFIKQTGPF
jgi:hypothetical protein